MHQELLHQRTFTPEHFLHQRDFTPKTFTLKSKDLLHQKAFTPEDGFFKELLHLTHFTPKSFPQKDPQSAKHNTTAQTSATLDCKTQWDYAQRVTRPHAKLAFYCFFGSRTRTRRWQGCCGNFENIHFSFTKVLAAILSSHPWHPSLAPLHLLRIILLLLGSVVIYGLWNLFFERTVCCAFGKNWKIYATNELKKRPYILLRFLRFSKYKARYLTTSQGKLDFASTEPYGVSIDNWLQIWICFLGLTQAYHQPGFVILVDFRWRGMQRVKHRGAIPISNIAECSLLPQKVLGNFRMPRFCFTPWTTFAQFITILQAPKFGMPGSLSLSLSLSLVQHKNTFPKTNSSPLKIGRAPKGN